MLSSRVRALTVVLLAIPAVALAQEQMKPPSGPITMSGQLVKAFDNMQKDIVEAASRMPEDQYGFKPTPEIKPFGQLVAHLAIAQFRDCAVLKGEPSPKKDEKEEATRTKADAIALLKASTDYCAPLVNALNESSLTELASVEKMQVQKGLIPIELAVHGMEMYGTMAVYLRLKGLVPPMTEREQQMKMKKSQ
ncbi:MAG TPA: DinB family protein [Vicinamibacterales bacterium]|jgi:hypothetical protein